MEEKRINKAISDTGFCSRRAADSYIEQGRVTVNGEIAVMGLKVTEKDEIRVDGKLVDNKPPLVYIALNKPRGIECTTNGSPSRAPTGIPVITIITAPVRDYNAIASTFYFYSHNVLDLEINN